MDKLLEIIEKYFVYFLEYCIIFIELVGALVLVYTVVKTVVGILRKKRGIRLALAEGIALALEFKMGGELLRTVIVREWSEILILGSVILLRAALTFLIQWEIKLEKKNALAEEKILPEEKDLF